ncbi:MAG: Gfo/Idh/MocA family oxidoreductase [Tepidisphaeraceae bacterium]
MPKRYAIVGTGGRCRMFLDAIAGQFGEHAMLVGLCDVSQTRMNYWNAHLARAFERPPLPTYSADRFDEMVRECRPDVVIVTTVDAFHARYVVRAMELGCDAISEKPMTIDATQTRAIFDAIARTGRSLRVAFNYRYQPAFTKLREIVASGEIGRVTSVDFQWYLDTSHGADYFRRWHREMHSSGGLLVHKSTHHFDLVNFWVASYPKTVFAMGDLKFYGRANAEARGEHYAYQRYTGSPEAKGDPFALFLDGEGSSGSKSTDALRGLYLNAEADSGYIRDRNVFGNAPPIDIYDTHAVMVRYRNNVVLNYSMFAYCPWEGERVTINGTGGQVEYFARGRGHVIRGQGDADLAAEQYQGEKHLRLQKLFQAPQTLEIPTAKGGHGGGDPLMLERLFVPGLPPDPLGRAATHVDGAASVLVGAAANQSIATGLPVQIDDLMPLPKRE